MAARVAIVFGVGPGLGGSVARKWASEGFSVACVARTPGKAATVAAEIGGNAIGYECDVTNASNLAECVAKVENDLGAIEMMCYNCGSGVWKTYDQITEEEFDRGFKSNAFGLLAAAQLICPKMVANGGGVVAVTGATASLRGKPFTAGFAASKAAQRSLTQSLARDLGPKGIHVFYVIIDGQIGDSSDGSKLHPDAIAETYFNLASQPKNCWTFEMDIRPSVENW